MFFHKNQREKKKKWKEKVQIISILHRGPFPIDYKVMPMADAFGAGKFQI